MTVAYPENFDVIVIGGGHAGAEAALAASRMGVKTPLLTQNIETLGQMSCNPAIGGIGKGHLVKEVDALGGVMARAIDHAGIHFRTLNASKGPAVRATRAQADRTLYKSYVRKVIEEQPNLHVLQQTVADLIIKNERVCGVTTEHGIDIIAKSVVLTVGTFLGGKIHIGQQQHSGGRAGDAPSNRLAERLRALPFQVGRLKTGTPPRLDGKTINYEKLLPQPGDIPLPVFSFIGSASEHPEQVVCHITKTTEKTHEIIRENLERSAMYSGMIEGIGPRYCPSIEDKVVRFAEKNSHQIFIEPEGLNTTEVYPNGVSTSLPFDVQWEFVRSIEGFENVQITRPGYAIEYDFFDPRELSKYLETRFISGLFFAGQINGTTGYEEAAAQGLIAGLNAALKVKDAPLWSPSRHEAYIGVLIDDLITLGTKEPYRMFTSRAEYRLSLREDNADFRLTSKGHDLGLVDDMRYSLFMKKHDAVEREIHFLQKQWIQPGTDAAQKLNQHTDKMLAKEYSLESLLKRPEFNYQILNDAIGRDAEVDSRVQEQVEVRIKYAGYIERQAKEISRLNRLETTRIPTDMNIDLITGLSAEVKQKLALVKPETLGQASRISGVTPAAISLLSVFIKKHKKVKSDVIKHING